MCKLWHVGPMHPFALLRTPSSRAPVVSMHTYGTEVPAADARATRTRCANAAVEKIALQSGSKHFCCSPNLTTSDFSAMGAGNQTALFLCCLLQFVAGAVIFSLGVFYCYIALSDNFDFDGAQIPIAVTVLGVMVVTTSLTGCWAFKRGNRNFLLCYVLLVIALILFQFAVGVGALVVSRNAREIGFVQWRSTNKAVIEDIENNLGCCGFNTTMVLRVTPACAQFRKPCLDVISEQFMTLGFAITALLLIQFLSLCVGIKLFASNSKASKKEAADIEENEKLLTGGGFNAL